MRSSGGTRRPHRGSGPDDGSAHPPTLGETGRAPGLGLALSSGTWAEQTPTPKRAQGWLHADPLAQQSHLQGQLRCLGTLQGPGGRQGVAAPPRRLCACPLEQACWPGVGQTQYLHSEEGP